MDKIIKLDLNTQRPASTNSIITTKPPIKKTKETLTGYIANSMNGGHIKIMGYDEIQGGQEIENLSLRLNLKQLTPLLPAYQKLDLTLKTIWCPYSAVWENIYKFESQKGGATETKIETMPNLGGMALPIWDRNGEKIAYTDTDIFRDSWASGFTPRFRTGMISQRYESESNAMPATNALIYRAFVASYNELLRNKEYDEELPLYKGDIVTEEEFNTYFVQPNIRPDQLKNYILRSRKRDSYFTNYRLELQGEYTGTSDFTDPTNSMSSLIEFEKKIAEIRSQSANSQKTDYDIIAELRGTEKLKERRPFILSERTIPINYESVVQTTYNSSETALNTQYQSLGQEGSYSFTECELDLVSYFKPNEPGVILIIGVVSCDTVFSTGWERKMLNINAMDRYRPDLEKLQDDVLYNIEMSSTMMNEDDLTKVVGFKRKYSEYFKMPNCIGGDLTSNYFVQTRFKEAEGNEPPKVETTDTDIITNAAYTFFEDSAEWAKRNDGDKFFSIPKQLWLDYTDLQLARNQAVAPEIESYTNYAENYTFWRILGQNQFDYVGMLKMITTLPMSGDAKDNKVEWGQE